MAVTAPVLGQEAVPERKGELAIVQKVMLREALKGTRVGDFRLLPALTVSSGHDSNIYATEDHSQGDLVTIVSPSVRLRSDWDEHALNLAAGADIRRYETYKTENTEDFEAAADGRFDFTERTYLFGGAGYSREHEDRTSPDDVLGEMPTPYYRTQGHLGLGRQGERFSIQGGVTFERINFVDVPYTLVLSQPGHGFGSQQTVTGEINNDDRDREVGEVGLRLGLQLTPVWELFVQGSANERDYDADLDDNGYNRSSDGAGGAAGLSWKVGRRVQGELLAGYLEQDYDDPALEDVATVDYGGRLHWRITNRTLATAYLDRSLEETTQPGASGYLYTLGGARLRHRVTGNFEIGAWGSYGEADFQGIPRTDEVVGGGASMQLFLYRQVYLEPEYQYTERISDLEGADYKRSRYLLTLGLEL